MEGNNGMNYTKYKNRKTVYRGITFDSEAEARRYAELLALSNAGVITNLRRQVKYRLIPTQKLIEPKKDCGGRMRHSEYPVDYVADFVYEKDGKTIVEDVKGKATDEYVIKRKLMLYVHGIQITEMRM